MVRNGDWDGALNLAADPLGLLGELPALQDDLRRLSQLQAKSRIDGMRDAMIKLGVKNVPTDYVDYISANGSGIDFQATADRLGQVYESHVRDQRLRETWGDDYENIRVGKSRMTVLVFELRVLDIHQESVDRYYDVGVDRIAKGQLKVAEGEYMRTLGSFIDGQVRDELRAFARSEGINDSSASKIWAINRRISSDLVEGYGIPDARIGNNILHDTTLAWKSGFTEQVQKWNKILGGKSSVLIIRPSQLPNGGAYVIPRAGIQPYMPTRNPTRGF